MTSLARSTGNSGALFEMSGTVPTNATWQEDIYFYEAGLPYDITGLDWKMTFREEQGNTRADITLSIADGTLEIVADDDDNERILRINVPAGQLNSYSGDYVADLASEDVNGKVDLWAHGVVSFRANPVAF